MGVLTFSDVDNLTAYIERIAGIRTRWKKKTRTWERQQVRTRGEEEALWFRGQPDAAQLSPKLYRAEYRHADEAEIRQQFQIRALQMIQGRVPDADDSWSWYFLMQHYGAPTRLLDWTDNPLVSLFFAVTDEQNKGNAAVWVVDPYWLNHGIFPSVTGPLLPNWAEAEDYLKPLEDAYIANEQVKRHRPAAIDPSHVDRRLAMQGSHFVIFGKSRDLVKNKIVHEKNARLAKITIRKSRRVTIEEELKDCGITVSFVYPDLVGLGRELSAFWRTR